MKLKVLVELKVFCEPPYTVGRWTNTLENKAKELEQWCRKFEEFVRDHRSQDPVSLSVKREYEEQCSHCRYKWETDEEGCPVCCNKAQSEWEEQNIIVMSN